MSLDHRVERLEKEMADVELRVGVLERDISAYAAEHRAYWSEQRETINRENRKRIIDLEDRMGISEKWQASAGVKIALIVTIAALVGSAIANGVVRTLLP